MHVIEDTSRPRAWMILKTKSNIGLCVVMLACLNDFRAILLEGPCRFCRGPNYGDVTGHMSIWILIENQNKVSLVRQSLRRKSARNLAPSGLGGRLGS